MRRRLLSLFAFVLLAAASVGCPGRTDRYQGTQHLTIQPIIAGGSFQSYTDTTFGDAVDPKKQVYLLDLEVSSNSGEFTWVTAVTGSAPGGEPLVAMESFQGNPVHFQVVNTGNIRPLFPDEHTFYINWDGSFAQTLSQAYPNGIELTFTYTLQIE